MTTATFSALDEPLGVGGTDAYGINNSGQIVGDYFDSLGTTHGFVATPSTTTNYTFSTLDAPFGAIGTDAYGINAPGQIVGGYTDSSGISHGFLYSNGAYTTLDDPLGINGSLANNINATGQIVGQYFDNSGMVHGFFYSGGTYTTLDNVLGTNGSAAFGINSAGQIVGEYFDTSGTAHGFLYSGGAYITLDDPQGSDGTIPFGINDSGNIVGEYFDSNGLAHGFFYSNGTYTTIDDALGAEGTIASGINNAGQIVGQYIDSSGTAHAFLANAGSLTPPPPATVQQEIVGLYVALYATCPTEAGIAYWINATNAFDPSFATANATTTAISVADETFLGQQFAQTQPTYFNSQYASLNDTNFVLALYQNLTNSSGSPAGVQYWVNLLTAAEASNGNNVLPARAGLAGQFAHDVLSVDLSVGATALSLTAAQYSALVLGQEAMQNKAVVAQYWATETGVPGGNILNFTSTTDPAFAAAQHVLSGITSDPSTVTVAITGINNAVAHQDLTFV